MSRSRLVLVVIATIAASMVLGGVAVAVTVAKPKTLSACTTKSHGVRLLGTKVKCHKSEKKLTWRVTGRAGAAGVRGPAGAKGAAGPRGVAGAAGANGATGKLGKVRRVTSDPVRLLSPAAGGAISAKALCAAGEQVVGGGFSLTDTANGQRDVMQGSLPFVDSAGLQGWEADIITAPYLPNVYHGVAAYALCAAAG
jgi:hypothetical protein